MSDDFDRAVGAFQTRHHPDNLDVRAEVKGIISRITRIDLDELEEDTRIREEIGVDSLMAMEIVARCEHHLGIHIDEAKLFEILTVGDFLDLVTEVYGKTTNRRAIT